MVHTNKPIIKHKAELLNLAEELGNVSQACKIMGVSRDTFYRYQKLVKPMLNDRALPFFDEQRLPILRIQTDRGAEYYERVDQHDYLDH